MAMIGGTIASQLPKKPGTAREQAILDLVRSGNAIVKWVPITVDLGGVRATFRVTAEPLMLGTQWDDGFYPGVTAATLQKIADYYDATLLTPKLVDEIWKQADIRIDPFIGMAGTPEDVQRMSDTDTFVRHTERIKSKLRGKRSSSGDSLVANIGKYWVVSGWTSRRQGLKSAPTIPSSENYGFFLTSRGSRRSVTQIADTNVVQTPGHAHDYNHSDYSQVVMMVAREVTLCEPTGVAGLGGDCSPRQTCNAPGGPGRTRCVDIYDLANSPELAGLLSHEGTINMRLPGVPYEGSRPPTPPGPVGRGGSGPVTQPGASTPASAPPPSKDYPSPPKTGSKPVTTAATSSGMPRRTLPGEKGKDVQAWQRFLMSQGFDLSPWGADGDHGKKTEQASLEWEKRQGKASTPIDRAAMGGGTKDAGLIVAVVAAAIGLGWLGYNFIEGKKS